MKKRRTLAYWAKHQREKCECSGYWFPHRRTSGACIHSKRADYYAGLRAGLSPAEAMQLLNANVLEQDYLKENP